MNGILASQVFFIISSVGFVILWIFVAILLYYLIRAVKTFARITEALESNINKIGDTTKELIEDLRDNKIFSLLLRKRRKSRKLED